MVPKCPIRGVCLNSVHQPWLDSLMQMAACSALAEGRGGVSVGISHQIKQYLPETVKEGRRIVGDALLAADSDDSSAY